MEAVKKAEELQPDLILLDLGLPKLNGMEAARRIRQLAPNSKILVVSQDASIEWFSGPCGLECGDTCVSLMRTSFPLALKQSSMEPSLSAAGSDTSSPLSYRPRAMAVLRRGTNNEESLV